MSHAHALACLAVAVAWLAVLEPDAYLRAGRGNLLRFMAIYCRLIEVSRFSLSSSCSPLPSVGLHSREPSLVQSDLLETSSSVVSSVFSSPVLHAQIRWEQVRLRHYCLLRDPARDIRTIWFLGSVSTWLLALNRCIFTAYGSPPWAVLRRRRTTTPHPVNLVNSRHVRLQDRHCFQSSYIESVQLLRAKPIE